MKAVFDLLQQAFIGKIHDCTVVVLMQAVAVKAITPSE